MEFLSIVFLWGKIAREPFVQDLYSNSKDFSLSCIRAKYCLFRLSAYGRNTCILRQNFSCQNMAYDITVPITEIDLFRPTYSSHTLYE